MKTTAWVLLAVVAALALLVLIVRPAVEGAKAKEKRDGKTKADRHKQDRKNTQETGREPKCPKGKFWNRTRNGGKGACMDPYDVNDNRNCKGSIVNGWCFLTKNKRRLTADEFNKVVATGKTKCKKHQYWDYYKRACVNPKGNKDNKGNNKGGKGKCPKGYTRKFSTDGVNAYCARKHGGDGDEPNTKNENEQGNKGDKNNKGDKDNKGDKNNKGGKGGGGGGDCPEGWKLNKKNICKPIKGGNNKPVKPGKGREVNLTVFRGSTFALEEYSNRENEVNILAVNKPDWERCKGARCTVTNKKNNKTIEGVVASYCEDNDCAPNDRFCCTRNANAGGKNFLLDLHRNAAGKLGYTTGVLDGYAKCNC